MAYSDLTARFVYGLQTVFGDFNKLANNDAFIKDNGWQDGTVGVFFQAAAPTGWTKVTTADARALRIVSGSGGGVGGSTDPSSTITLAHTNSVSTEADHTHSLVAHSHILSNTGSDFSAALSHKDVGTVLDPGELFIADTSGGTSLNRTKNSLSMTGSYTSGAGGTHSHGGATDSQLSNIALAYLDIIFCSKDTSSGYTNLTSTFVHNTRHVFDYMDQLAENDAYNYARRTPAGTISIFGSATAPTGWTKLTTQDARLLRVVSGTPSSGGSYDPATLITLAHTHSDLTSGGAHTHSIPNHVHQLDIDSTATIGTSSAPTVDGHVLRRVASVGGVSSDPATINSNTATDGGGTSDSGGAHQHAIGSSLTNITLAYFNVIQASKDSTGAPASYTDMTTFFVDQDLLAYQDLQSMANNDAYLYYHTMPSTSVMFFFQASAPLNWTKVTTQNDVLLRIVSGALGGSGGGTTPVSGGITLAHTHSIDAKAHTHTYPHTHTLEHSNVTVAFTLDATARIYGASGARMYSALNTGGGDPALKDTTDSTTASTDSVSHNHTGLTGSSLTNVVLSYADVIMCSKN